MRTPNSYSGGRRRVRISVPEGDQTVHAWLDAQENVGYSLRQLIKAYVAEHGVTDIMCQPIGGIARADLPAVPAEAAVPPVTEPVPAAAAAADTVPIVPQAAPAAPMQADPAAYAAPPMAPGYGAGAPAGGYAQPQMQQPAPYGAGPAMGAGAAAAGPDKMSKYF